MDTIIEGILENVKINNGTKLGVGEKCKNCDGR